MTSSPPSNPFHPRRPVRSSNPVDPAYSVSLTPVGRAVASLGLVGWILGWLLGWAEFGIAVLFAGMLLVVAVLFTLSASLGEAGEIVLTANRVTAGESVGGSVQLRSPNRRWHRLIPRLLIDDDVVDVALDRGTSGTSHFEFVVRATQRGIVSVGPLIFECSDPLGLCTRRIVGAPARELIVHPVTVDVPPLDGDRLAESEEGWTPRASTNGLDFHSLRPFVDGDDRRHVDWKSTAKHGSLVVRHYVDSLPFSMDVVFGTAQHEYRDATDFETTISAAASLALSVQDGEVRLFAGATALPVGGTVGILDACAEIGIGSDEDSVFGALSAVSTGGPVGRRVRFVVIPVGVSVAEIGLALDRQERAMDVIVVLGAAESSCRGLGDQLVLDVPSLGDLPSLVAWISLR